MWIYKVFNSWDIYYKHPSSQIYIKIPRENSVISLLNSYLDLNFEVIKKTDSSKFANGVDVQLVNLGHFAFFSNFKLTTESRKHLEFISHAILFFQCIDW